VGGRPGRLGLGGRAIAFGETAAFLSSVIPAGMTATERSENPNAIALGLRGVNGVPMPRVRRGFKAEAPDLIFAPYSLRPAGSCITAKAALAALAGKNHFIDPAQAAADQVRASAIAVAYMPRPKTEWPITLLRRVTLGLGVLEPAIPIPIPGIIMK
jgi:hypothetical protein